MSQQVSRLDPLFAPRGIAVIGASRDPGRLGAVMLRSLRPFGGPVADVNPLRITGEGMVALDAVLRTADD
jgi:acyl-CoA synthetase (NDP forming)